jgi:hypothetical protein
MFYFMFIWIGKFGIFMKLFHKAWPVNKQVLTKSLSLSMPQIKILIEDEVLFFEINHILKPAMRIKISFDKLNSIQQYYF